MLSGKPHRNDISYSCIVFIPNLHCTEEESSQNLSTDGRVWK